MKKIAYLGVVLMMFSAFASAGEVGDKIEARIAELNAAWNSGDHESVLAIFDKGFVVIPGEGEPMTDREKWGKMLAAEVIDYPNIVFKSSSLVVHDPNAYTFGVASYDYKDEAGKVLRGEVDYLIIWIKDDKGAWNIQLETWWSLDSDSEKDATEKAKIAARTVDMLAAWNSEDADSFASFYTKEFLMVGQNAEVIQHNSKPMSDREALEQQWATEVSEYPNMNYERTSIEVNGNYAYEIGVSTYDWPELGEDGQGIDDFLFVWKKDEHGVWKIRIELYWESESDE